MDGTPDTRADSASSEGSIRLALKRALASHAASFNLSVAELAREIDVTHTVASRMLDEAQPTKESELEAALRRLGYRVEATIAPGDVASA